MHPACVELAVAARIGLFAKRKGRKRKRTRRGKQRAERRSGQVARRNGGDSQGASGHHGHEARSRVGNRSLSEAARGRREQVRSRYYTVMSSRLPIVMY